MAQRGVHAGLRGPSNHQVTQMGSIITSASYGTMEYIGTHNGVSAGVYGGPMVVFGASEIDPIIGESRYQGVTASIDAEIQGSVNFIDGKSRWYPSY